MYHVPGLLLASIILTTCGVINTVTILYRADSLDASWLLYAVLASLGMGFMPLAAYLVLVRWGLAPYALVFIADLVVWVLMYLPFYAFEKVVIGGEILRVLRIANLLCLPNIVLAGVMAYGVATYFVPWLINTILVVVGNVVNAFS